MKTFTPSLDWGNELMASAVWLSKAWVISAVCIVIVLTVIARITVWGRQFWRVTGDYFTGAASAPVWSLLGVLLLLVLVDVRLVVLLSYQSKDMLDALQAAFEGVGSGDDILKHSGQKGFWVSLALLCVLIAARITHILLDTYLMQRFIIRWRVWLTRRLTADWLDGQAYYRGRFIDDPIDNPDQRIQNDVDIFTTGQGPQTNSPTIGTAQTLLFGAVSAIVSLVAFTPILWNQSGPLTILGITMPKALFWIVLLYVGFATAVAFWIGHPLIRLSFRNQMTNAAFRYALVRVRDAAEAVGFYRGAGAESGELARRFDAIITNYRAFVRRNVIFLGWNQALNRITEPLPLIVQAERVFKGQITYGDVAQSSNAFTAVQDSLSWFRSVYDSFASYRASIIRLEGLVTANEQARQLPALTVAGSTDGSVQLDDVEVRTPWGTRLIDPVDVRLAPGDAMVITGPSGCGKTTLLRSLAQLWPYTTGTVRYPADHTMFLSQVPYIPLGDLRTVLAYPRPATEFDDAAIQSALRTVALGHLGFHLDEVQDWAKVLSPGEQQRIAFARVLLSKPRVVFLDESTSALDEGQEFALYNALRIELPDCVVVSVSHRPSLERHHDKRLELLGGGEWRLTPVQVPS